MLLNVLFFFQMALKIKKALYGAVSYEVVHILLQLGRLCISEQMFDKAEAILFECLSLQSRLTGTLEPEENSDQPQIIQFAIHDLNGNSTTVNFFTRDIQSATAEAVNLIAFNYNESNE